MQPQAGGRSPYLFLMENLHHQRAKLVTTTDKGRRAFEAAVKLQEPWVKALSTGRCKSRIDDA